MTTMPDISEFQPGADMAGIAKKNGGLVIIRAGYSTSHHDLSFDKHRANAHKAGMKAIGIYHYVVPSAHSATAHAQAFCSWVGKRQPGEFFILDLEEGSGNLATWAATWTAYVRKNLGGHIMIYSGESFMNSHGLGSVMGAATGWIAAYRSTEPTHPHLLWQSTDGKVGAHRTSWPGAGYCDTNYTPLTVAQFVSVVGGEAPAPVVPEEDQVGDILHVGWSGSYDLAGNDGWNTAKFDNVIQDDNSERAKNGVSSATLFSHKVLWSGELNLSFESLPADGVTVRVVEVKKDAQGHWDEITNISGSTWFPGTGHSTQITATWIAHRNEKDRKTYVQYNAFGKGVLKSAYFRAESKAL